MDRPLTSFEGFSYDPSQHAVLQHVQEDGRALERRFEIDTLEARFQPSRATAATPAAEQWLQSEADTLLDGALGHPTRSVNRE